MPPLCTAGFGVATGNLYYFFGAFYLYFINTVFISLATFLVVRLLKFPKKEFLDKQREKKVNRYVGLIVLFTICPSIYLSYNLVKETYFNTRVQQFVADELNFPNTQILSKTISDHDGVKSIKVLMIGQQVPEEMIANARGKMPKFGLSNVALDVQQGVGQETPDINMLKGLLLQDLYKNSEEMLRVQTLQIDSLERNIQHYQTQSQLAEQLVPEMRVLFPSINEVSCANTILMNVGQNKPDSVLLVYLKSNKTIPGGEQKKIQEWLGARLESDKIKLIIE